MDLISIIIPVYNVEKYIEKCAQSLFEQSYKNLELIFVNDGSKDSSGELCHRIANENSEETISVIVIDKENGGVSSARNRGLKVATGKYIMYVDPDDYCENTYVEKLYNAIVDSDSDMAECSYFVDHISGDIVAKSLPFSETVINDVYGALFYDGQSLDKLPAYLWLSIFKADVIKENNIRFDENVKYGEDFLFFVEYSKHCQKIAIVNEPLYHSVHREGSSASRLEFSVDHFLKIIYLTDEFVRIMRDKEWKFKSQYIAKRYVNFIPQAAILIARSKKIKNRKKEISILMDKSKIIDKISKYSKSKLSTLEKIYRTAVLKRHTTFLLLYGRCFNALKKIKNSLKA